VHSPWLAIPIGLLWLVGMTNAFNLLDNMDGLAGSLAVISAAFFASAAALQSGSRLVLVMSLALACAVVGFLPFNLRPGRPALAWMGDSGSQLIGFTLAALGLASSYTVATSTVATLVLPVLVLAVPILDTTLVTIVRLLDGRPVSQGGRDHSSHRLVSLGVSETGAVVLLALVSAALGATSLAYEAFGSGRVAALGVLVTFALLVQFGSFLADVDRSRTGPARLYLYTRRLAEVIVDGALIAASFLAAYLLRFDGTGTPNQRHYFLLTLPVLLFCRYGALLLTGMYAGVWRYASSRDALRAAFAVGVSGVVALGIVVLTHGELGDFSRSVFVIDALICTIALTGARFAERAIVRGIELARAGEGRRVLIVGAGRTGRSMLRELRETPGERVVAFVDDDPRLRGRRLNGVRVAGATTSLATVLDRTRPDIVFVTIPNAPKERLDELVQACAAREIDCRFVRREIDVDPRVILGVDR
jgi:UDP-GlcNAc:undecaprenyl-phosphate GlcNAc-1-phosphate transferase